MWLPGPDATVWLSQGDLLDGIAVGPLVAPRVAVKPRSVPGHQSAYLPDDAPDSKGMYTMLARVQVTRVLVVSHSCEIDKPNGSRLIAVAPVRPITTLNAEHVADVVSFHSGSKFPLLGLPGLGDSYADLRQIQSILPRQIEKVGRLASLTPASVLLLRRHLTLFFARPSDDIPEPA